MKKYLNESSYNFKNIIRYYIKMKSLVSNNRSNEQSIFQLFEALNWASWNKIMSMFCIPCKCVYWQAINYNLKIYTFSIVINQRYMTFSVIRLQNFNRKSFWINLTIFKTLIENCHRHRIISGDSFILLNFHHLKCDSKIEIT